MYNRALALRYLGELATARQWSEPIAVAVYKGEKDAEVVRLASPGLMLHAGILLDLIKDDDALLDRAADRALAEPRRVKAQKKLISDPSAIEWYVRLGLGDGSGQDARGHYNVACYLARLAELAPHRADDLAPRVIEHVRGAFADSRLATWAERDPALEQARARYDWKRLRARTAAAPAFTEAVPAGPEPSPSPPPEASAPSARTSSTTPSQR